jgi:ABC-type spermidine/putrescine transport system permease subunit II
MHAVNGGVPLLVFSLVFAGAIAVVLWRRRYRRDGTVDWVVVGPLAAHVALVVAGLFQVFQTDDEVEFTLYFTLACALAHVAQRRGVEAGG